MPALLPLLRRRIQRQADVEHRAPRLRVDGEAAAVALRDDAVRGVEPESRALADPLGGEERLEDALADVGRDARAVVTDLDERARPVAPGPDRERAGLAERVDRVVDQVRP